VAVTIAICLLGAALSGALIATYATEYENVEVTYADGSVETYIFSGCFYGKPRWILPFFGVDLGFVFYYDDDDYYYQCPVGEWIVLRTDECTEQPCDGVPWYTPYFLIGISDPVRALASDDLSELGWDVYPRPSGTPVSITGGDFLSGERCCPECANPVISGIPEPVAVVGVEYSFEPTSSIDCMYWTIESKPGWATFEPSKWWYDEPARLSGTPGCSDRGVYPGIVITVEDENGESDSIEFTITVVDPTAISGCPEDILVVLPEDGTPATANWVEPTAESACGVQSFISSHAPGDEFSLGTTTVTYTATGPDNVASCSFDVAVVYHSADINQDGRVDVLDARLCYQMAVGVLIGTPYERGAADVDDDGDVDMDDAVALAEYVIGMRNTLPW